MLPAGKGAHDGTWRASGSIGRLDAVLAVAGCDGFLPEKVCPASGSRDRGWRSGFISSRLVSR
jgi:hypothetical protein